MELTREKAIDISIELWTHLEETGEDELGKVLWGGWHKYGAMRGACALCEYDHGQEGNCQHCPYYQRFWSCAVSGGPYREWRQVQNSDDDRKKYAGMCLEQLKQLKEAANGRAN